MIDLKARRESLGLSQEDIAKKINVTRGTVSKWEKGDIANMKRDKIASLSRVLKINPLLLLGMDPNEEAKSKYNYFDVGLSAGALCEVSPFKNTNVKQLTLPDDVMGKYAGSPDIILSRVNGESMNRVIPDGSLIAIEKVNSVFDIKNGDIVVFQDCSEMAIKRFYNNTLKRTIIFTPDSTNSSFTPMSYSYDDLANVRIIGRVVVYIVSI